MDKKARTFAEWEEVMGAYCDKAYEEGIKQNKGGSETIPKAQREVSKWKFVRVQ